MMCFIVSSAPLLILYIYVNLSSTEFRQSCYITDVSLVKVNASKNGTALCLITAEICLIKILDILISSFYHCTSSAHHEWITIRREASTSLVPVWLVSLLHTFFIII